MIDFLKNILGMKVTPPNFGESLPNIVSTQSPITKEDVLKNPSLLRSLLGDISAGKNLGLPELVNNPIGGIGGVTGQTGFEPATPTTPVTPVTPTTPVTPVTPTTPVTPYASRSFTDIMASLGLTKPAVTPITDTTLAPTRMNKLGDILQSAGSSYLKSRMGGATSDQAMLAGLTGGVGEYAQMKQGDKTREMYKQLGIEIPNNISGQDIPTYLAAKTASAKAVQDARTALVKDASDRLGLIKADLENQGLPDKMKAEGNKILAAAQEAQQKALMFPTEINLKNAQLLQIEAETKLKPLIRQDELDKVKVQQALDQQKLSMEQTKNQQTLAQQIADRQSREKIAANAQTSKIPAEKTANLKLTNQYRGELIKSAGTFDTIKTAYKKMEETTKQDPTPASDMSLIYSFMRLQDPTSTVRETEFQMAAKAGNYGQELQNAVSRLANGQRLQPEQRKDFVDRGRGMYKAEASTMKDNVDYYSQLARDSGLDVNAVVGKYKDEVYKAGAPSISDTRKALIDKLKSQGKL